MPWSRDQQQILNTKAKTRVVLADGRPASLFLAPPSPFPKAWLLEVSHVSLESLAGTNNQDSRPLGPKLPAPNL